MMRHPKADGHEDEAEPSQHTLCIGRPNVLQASSQQLSRVLCKLNGRLSIFLEQPAASTKQSLRICSAVCVYHRLLAPSSLWGCFPLLALVPSTPSRSLPAVLLPFGDTHSISHCGCLTISRVAVSLRHPLPHRELSHHQQRPRIVIQRSGLEEHAFLDSGLSHSDLRSIPHPGPVQNLL